MTAAQPRLQEETARQGSAGAVTTAGVSRDGREELLQSLARHERPVVYVENGSCDGQLGCRARPLPAGSSRGARP